jgi:hypothetical protein
VPTPEFETWWAEVQREPGVLRDSHDTAQRLGRRLEALDPDEQGEFLGQLIPVLLQRHRAYGIALFLLDSLSDPAVLGLIAEHLQPFPGLQTHDEEAHLADLVRILAAAHERELLPAVEAYLLKREIGSHWATVPWALWPHETELFVRAWERFFHERPAEEWSDPLAARSFLSEPDAIVALRRHLQTTDEASWPTLRDTLLEQADKVSWFSPDQLEALENALK